MNKFTFAATLLLASSAFATAMPRHPNVPKRVVFCEAEEQMPDNTLELIVTTGGFVGLPQLTITRGTIVGARVENHIVRQIPQRGPKALVYKNQAVTLKVDLGSSSHPDGGLVGVLVTEHESRALICHLSEE